MTASNTTPAPAIGKPARMSTLDKYLAVWIGLAMVTGLLLGRWIPSIADALDTITIGSVSLPIATGLPAMMYPVLARVRSCVVGHVARDPTTTTPSLDRTCQCAPAHIFH